MQALGRTGFLINVSRGFVINQNDLIHALTNDLIAGAALDVFENEPNVPKKLFNIDNVASVVLMERSDIKVKSTFHQSYAR